MRILSFVLWNVDRKNGDVSLGYLVHFDVIDVVQRMASLIKNNINQGRLYCDRGQQDTSGNWMRRAKIRCTTCCLSMCLIT